MKQNENSDLNLLYGNQTNIKEDTDHKTITAKQVVIDTSGNINIQDGNMNVSGSLNVAKTYGSVSTTFTSQGNWVNASGTHSYGNTEQYSEGALKLGVGYVHLATGGAGFSTALVTGSLYLVGKIRTKFL